MELQTHVELQNPRGITKPTWNCFTSDTGSEDFNFWNDQIDNFHYNKIANTRITISVSISDKQVDISDKQKYFR